MAKWDRHKDKAMKRFEALPDQIKMHYEHRLLVDHILVIHSGEDAKHFVEWHDVVLQNGVRDHWFKNWRWPDWNCNSVQIHKAAMKQQAAVERSSIIGRLRRGVKCRECGADLAKGQFVRGFLEGLHVKFAICMKHELHRGMEEKLWERSKAPRERKVYKRQQIKKFVRKHGLPMNAD